ncbi:MAG: transposase, partial [Allobaculum sp.]|nr:transposase [Allobaculum sp.]
MRRINLKSEAASLDEIILVEKHLFRLGDLEYKELDDLTFKSKNLYNATLYAMRQFFFKHHYFPGYATVTKEFTHSDQPDYRALPAKVSKHVQMQADEACKSFAQLNEMYKAKALKNRPKIPKYLHKQKGRCVLHYERGAISKRSLKKGLIHLSQTNLYIPTKADPSHVQFVRIVPKNQVITVEVGYKKELTKQKQECCRIAALDLGVNNLAVCSSNVMAPILIDGKYLKSVNQRANKAIAAAQSY